MEFINYIVENALVFIPVLYVLGAILKGTEKIEDKYIPGILLPIGVLLSMWTMGITVDAVVQGILVVGAAVYTNQVVKQAHKGDE